MLKGVGVQVADYISQQRLMARLAQLAEFGALPHGGVNRQALSGEELAARAWLIDWAFALGCEVITDDCANLFIRRAGREDLPPVVTGSHIDTQPCGGNLDGCYGVIAGMECLSALAQAEITTLRPIEVAIWMNEEGSRFSPGAMGSSAFVQPQRLADYQHHQDAQGISLQQALARCHQRFPHLPRRGTVPMAAFVELHIEQGPVLEKANQPLAVVQGIQGVRWYQVSCLGQSAHAGTTPMGDRKDAMSLARQMAQQLEEQAATLPADQLRLTFGRWEVEPNAINTIASRATFTLDFRHEDPAVLAQFDDWMQQIAADNVLVECVFSHPPVAFNTQLLAQQYACTQALQIDTATLTSGAFHDAMHLASHCPTSMFFVPSHNGISHNPAEYTDPQYLYLGAKALACCLTELANQPIGVPHEHSHLSCLL
ncbi:TPA: M20 family metallo-hydrolase [Yersinia enterocolitica]|uniref:Zn-dependent hydrolase n=1 Tax=Yersinia massiliensis TaxID=419257 RepID=A0ABM6UX01_9GAMM|nr:M20 family metallo-hydrolase [Yersinia massiliensis]AVX39372.1 Zn-dependent hydrolase [Yersinia massiliensis]QKJ10134.1 M20 family metallo-hydrolase [Yersinia massiliensis]